MGTFRLIHGHRHGQQTNRPPSGNPPHEDHGQIDRRSLQKGAKETDQGADEDGHLPPVAIHGQAAHQGAEDGAAVEGRVDGADDGAVARDARRVRRRVEVDLEVGRSDHVGHHAGVVAEEEGSVLFSASCQRVESS